MTAIEQEKDYQDNEGLTKQPTDSQRKSNTAGKTPRGKEIQIVKDPTAQGWYIQFTTGGQIPEYLQGLWTNYNLAKNRVQSYLNNSKKK